MVPRDVGMGCSASDDWLLIVQPNRTDAINMFTRKQKTVRSLIKWPHPENMCDFVHTSLSPDGQLLVVFAIVQGQVFAASGQSRFVVWDIRNPTDPVEIYSRPGTLVDFSSSLSESKTETLTCNEQDQESADSTVKHHRINDIKTAGHACPNWVDNLVYKTANAGSLRFCFLPNGKVRYQKLR